MGRGPGDGRRLTATDDEPRLVVKRGRELGLAIVVGVR